MREYHALLRNYFADPLARPMRVKELAHELGLGKNDFKRFKDAVEELVADGKLLLGKNKLVRSAAPPDLIAGTVRRTGRGNGFFTPHDPEAAGARGLELGESLYVSPEDLKDAFTGDEVLVQLLRSRMKGQRCGRVMEVISRGSQAFVGTYFERRDHGFVRIDGDQFEGPIGVGDPGAKGVLPEDRVVIEMLRYPSRQDAGEAVITKVLGPRGAPGVDLQTILIEFGLPDEFPEAVLAEARLQARMFEEGESNEQRVMSNEAEGRDGEEHQASGDDSETVIDEAASNSMNVASQPHRSSLVAHCFPRLDLTSDLIITIDPVDARDFDDAISLTREDDGNWRLGVHIADVAHFVRPGTLLDKEAKLRGTSVYLPDKVLPMLPEVISNALASLQEGRVRYTKSVFITFSPDGVPLHSEFANSKIKVTQRFAYEQVMPLIESSDESRVSRAREEESVAESGIDPTTSAHQPSTINHPPPAVAENVLSLLRDMHSLAMTLRKRRFQHGSLDLNLPEIKVDMSRAGKVLGAHRLEHDESHQIIEEFMLAANVAVATKLTDLNIPFLRRNHAGPDETKLRVLSDFARSLGHKLTDLPGRAELQKLLNEVRGTPLDYAISYAVLRSLKQATYGPESDIGHYALNFANYCHFTSPIRRYPDLAVHRLLDEVIEEEGGRAKGEGGSGEREIITPRVTQKHRRGVALQTPPSEQKQKYPPELVQLGKWCSMTERRAQEAERELVKLKLLGYLAEHVGEQLSATITGVEHFGLFCTGIVLPAEGLVPVATLDDDYYDYDERSHTLTGRRRGHVHRLGDQVEVVVSSVNLPERKLELRLVQTSSSGSTGSSRQRRDNSSAARFGKKNQRPKFPSPSKRRGRRR